MEASNSNALAALIVVGGALYLFRDKDPNNDPRDTTDVQKGQEPTMDRNQARNIAEAVESAIYSDGTFWYTPGFGSMTENEDLVIEAMTSPEIKTEGDFVLIAEVYGVRGTMMTPDLTLVQVLKKYLDTNEREVINKVYAQRGIPVTL